MNNTKKRTVNCPNCRESVVYDVSNPYRPFCSERCKVMDIASWATEAYRIPASEVSSEHELDDLG